MIRQTIIRTIISLSYFEGIRKFWIDDHRIVGECAKEAMMALRGEDSCQQGNKYDQRYSHGVRSF